MKTNKIIYYGATGLLTLLMIFSAGMYFFNHAAIAEVFVRLGYPAYIIYPLAAAKILGLIAIWSNYSRDLKQWAYAGFFYDFLLALAAHVNAKDGEWLPAFVALILLMVSYFLGRNLEKHSTNN